MNYKFRQVNILIAGLCLLVAFSSCSIHRKISRHACKLLLKDSAIMQGHIGISIFEPATGKYWYEHNAEKYFVSASNTKIFSLYAGMKYLGDSIVGLRYLETADSIFVEGTGDPTLLHPDFSNHAVLSFLKDNTKPKAFRINYKDKFSELGSGWAWSDFEASYMAERSALPVYGNIATFRLKNGKLQSTPASFAEKLYMVIPPDAKFTVNREQDRNKFYLSNSNSPFTVEEIPFRTEHSGTAIEILADSIGMVPVLQISTALPINAKRIFSQASDSLFKLMMHRSDNFFAEQTLLMASNEYLGYMSDGNMIDTILKTELMGIPQKPKWVDGSGLSRYNLFTPQSFVWLLGKMKNEFGWERIKNILPTGGEGTLSSYYKTEQGFIYAKTGTLSNNCALSGYLITKKNKLLVFSVLANNYQTSATPVRRAVERFLKGLREEY